MKKLIQLFLLFLLIIISFFIYQTYFKPVEIVNLEKKTNKQETSIENQNNLIKNLKYEVKFDDDTRYIITSKLSEITYVGDSEIVKMQIVKAILINENNIPLIIESKNAIYNNNTYDTQFSNQVTLKYIDNVIISNNLDVNFDKNIVTIYDNVVYEGLQGTVRADNVLFDLNTKDIKIFMNKSKEKIQIKTN